MKQYHPFRGLQRRLLGTVTNVATIQKVAALTFDDGPSSRYTPGLLDVLDRHGARATFFMVGEAAGANLELVAEVASRGHAIGNHSWSHASFTNFGGRERKSQIQRCQAMLEPHGARLLRPPYGHQGLASRLDALRMGYDVVGWNASGDDWLDDSAATIYDRLNKALKPGCIALLHDSLHTASNASHLNRLPTIDAVDRILSERQDFRFVTVPSLMRAGRVVRRYWVRRGDPAWLRGQRVWSEQG